MGATLEKNCLLLSLFILLVQLTSFKVQSILTSDPNTVHPTSSDLSVDLTPSTLLHRRNTRSNLVQNSNPNGNSRWIPGIHPKFRKPPPNDPRFVGQRAFVPLNNPRAMSSNLRPMTYHPYLPPLALPLTRPSQPDQPTGYVTSSPPQPTPPPAIAYLPASTHDPPTDDLSPNPSESELRFLFHRPEDESLIKSTILEESERYNERVSFVRGPTLKFQRRQTIYLPPRKKSVIYVMLKEPQVQTDLEVIEPQVDNTPEVNIVYEKAGGVISKHYYSTSDKLLQNSGSSGGSGGNIKLTEVPTPHNYESTAQDLTSHASEVKTVRRQIPAMAPPSLLPQVKTNATFDPVGGEMKRSTPPHRHLIPSTCQAIFNNRVKEF